MKYYTGDGNLYRSENLRDWSLWNGSGWSKVKHGSGSNILLDVTEISEAEAEKASAGAVEDEAESESDEK